MYTHIDETKYGTGAIVTKKSKKVAKLGSAKPVDFTVHFQIATTLVQKDQGQSSSCGGQATAYREEVLEGIPQSAKSIYSLCYVAGGGSNEPALWNTIYNNGVAKEADITSYESGQTPSEAFMEDTSWDKTKLKAEKDEHVVYVNLDMDSIAQAIKDNNGVILGISGMNNGTWLSADPLPPTTMTGTWGHWVFAVGYCMRNGKRAIKFINSWGASVGENGYQYLSEDYLPYIWTAWTYIKTKNFIFNIDLGYGITSPDVTQLQIRLGMPTKWQSGYFGIITKGYVMAYQLKNGIPATGFCGPITRASLNRP